MGSHLLAGEITPAQLEPLIADEVAEVFLPWSTANAKAIAGYLELNPGERAVQSLPMHYSYGLSVLNSHLLAGALWIAVERTQSARAADLRLVDLVAPSSSPAWFLRHFRCGAVPVCDEEADELLDHRRAVVAQPRERGEGDAGHHAGDEAHGHGRICLCLRARAECHRHSSW